MNTTKLFRRLAILSLGPLAAGAVLVGGAGSVSAPGPADLTANLSGYTGATAAAVYADSGAPTTVKLWPGVWTSSGGTLAAGTPCSPGSLLAGERATKTIQVNSSGSQARCV